MSMICRSIGVLVLATLLLGACGGNTGRNLAVGAAGGAAGGAASAAIRGDDVLESAAVGAASGAAAGAAAGVVASLFGLPVKGGARGKPAGPVGRLQGVRHAQDPGRSVSVLSADPWHRGLANGGLRVDLPAPKLLA